MEIIQRILGPNFVLTLPVGLMETDYLRIKGPFIHNGEFILIFIPGVEKRDLLVDIKRIVRGSPFAEGPLLVDYISVFPSEFEWYFMIRIFSIGLTEAILEQLRLIVSDGVSLENFPGAKVFAIIGEECICMSKKRISQVLTDPYWRCLEKYFSEREGVYWFRL